MINKFQRPNTRAGIYIPRNSDKELIQTFTASLSAMSKEELVRTYNGIKNIWGVHAQLVYLYVLNTVFIEKFGESPIIVEEDTVYFLGPKIYYSVELDRLFQLSEN